MEKTKTQKHNKSKFNKLGVYRTPAGGIVEVIRFNDVYIQEDINDYFIIGNVMQQISESNTEAWRALGGQRPTDEEVSWNYHGEEYAAERGPYDLDEYLPIEDYPELYI